MSSLVELGLVLDTTQYMYNAIQDIKDNLKDTLRVIPSDKTLKVFVVSYNNFKQISIERLERLNDHQINKCIKAPFKPQTLPALQPILVFAALNRALSYSWKAPKRILLLIGSNPPHGLQYHKLGGKCDIFPKGNPVYNLEGTVSKFQQ
eukprot:363889_1